MLGVSYYQQKEDEHLSSYSVELWCKNKRKRNIRYSFKYFSPGVKKTDNITRDAYCFPCHQYSPCSLQKSLPCFHSIRSWTQTSREGLLGYSTAVQVQIILFHLHRKHLSSFVGDLTNNGDYDVAMINTVFRRISFLW